MSDNTFSHSVTDHQCETNKQTKSPCYIFTQADGIRGGRVFTVVNLSVYLHGSSKSNAARNTKLDIQMFHEVHEES